MHFISVKEPSTLLFTSVIFNTTKASGNGTLKLEDTFLCAFEYETQLAL